MKAVHLLFSGSVLFLGATGATFAAEFFVDQFRGSAEGNGSWQVPWKDVNRVLAEENFQPGDILWIGSGAWGTLVIENLRIDEPGLLITSLPPEIPEFDGVDILASSGLNIEIMAVVGNGRERRDLVLIDEASSKISIEDFEIAGARVSEGWNRESWAGNLSNAIMSHGSDISISGNWITTVDHGISATGARTRIDDNVISEFTGDGIRVLGNGSTVHGNEIFNCLDVDDNHDDGIQGWSLDEVDGPGGGIIKDVTLSANIIIERVDPSPPFPCSLQGIGLFDGFYENWTIENNVIATSAWHGITVMGADGVIIRNNTVVDINLTDDTIPWISATAHKDGRVSRDTQIYNNIVPLNTVDKGAFAEDQPGVARMNNLVVDQPEAVFVAPSNLNFNLKPGGPAIDRGIAIAPSSDVTGAPRDDAAPDIGAFEFR